VRPKQGDGPSKADLDDWKKLRGIWRKDPVSYCRHRLGLNPTHQQAALLEAIEPPGAKVTARAGHGIGKSSATGGAIWWMLETSEYPKIPCTAPTSAQLQLVLWAELAKWLRKSDEASMRWGLHPAFWLSNLFDFSATRITDKGAPDEWFAVARTSRRENPDALQGFHASDIVISADGRSVVSEGDGGQIMFVVEEASGVPDAVFEVAEGALSSHGARLLMIGNPTKNEGYFARSHKQDRSSYTPLHFKCSDSPLVDPDYRKRLVRKFGEGSNVVRVRADGEFPKQDDDVLIPLEHAEAPLTRELKPEMLRGRRRLGADVARFGSDRTVILLRHGAAVLHIEVHAKEDTMTTAGRIWRAAWELKVDDVCVDEGGLGAGVVDRLNELKRQHNADPRNVRCTFIIIGVNASSAAPDRKPGEGVPAQGAKMRDFMWLATAEWLKNEAPVFQSKDVETREDLAGELSVVRYGINSNGELVVETKDEMKKRLDGRSPDIADSLGVTFYEPPRKAAGQMQIKGF